MHVSIFPEFLKTNACTARRFTCWLCFAGVFLLTIPVSGAERSSTADRRRQLFVENHQKLLLNLRYELSELSNQCHADGLSQAAQDITALSLELTSPLSGRSLPRFVQLPVSQQLSAAEQLWRNRLRALRAEKARELYVLARKALNSNPKLPTLAYQMTLDVLRMDPDHELARAVFGQQMFHDPLLAADPTYAGEWVSPFEARKRAGSKPEVDHPVYGWIPTAHVARYEEGLRPWRGQWVSVQKEAELRRDFSNAWEISSEHFLVRTNTSREEGVQISRNLEAFHEWMQANFAAFFETPETLAARFEQVVIRRRSRSVEQPMEVQYFANRNEYDQKLRGKIPPNIVTNGLYWEPDQTSYFFRNPETEGFSTVYHEATHQILDHATRDDRMTAARQKQRITRQRTLTPWVLCEKSNFWLIEGLACYFESFETHEGVVTVGRPDYVRFVAAQHRLLKDNFYVPLQPFSGMGQQEFQQHPGIAQLYSQASGVAHFLMHYGDGLYRDDLVTLLSEVYRPDPRNVMKQPALDEITGVPFAKLDQQYREHLENMMLQHGGVFAKNPE